MTQLVCFINEGKNNGELDYEDGIFRSILNENQFIILFKGQAKRTTYDEKLSTMNPHFFYRTKRDNRYKYIGQAYTKRVVIERSDENIIQLEYKINIENNILPYGTIIEPVIQQLRNDKTQRDFKSGSFTSLNLIPFKYNRVAGVSLANEVEV